MTKLRLTLMAFCLSLLLAPHNAKADIEAPQKVMGVIRKVNEGAESVQEVYSMGQRAVQSVSTGIGNAVQKFNAIKENPLGEGEELLNKTVSDIKSVNDPLKAQEEVTATYNSDPSKGNSVNVIQAQREKMYAIQRENLANLYSVAFTTRSLLAQAREKDEPENDLKDSREIIKLTNEKALEMAKRMRNVMKIESATYEFLTTQQTIGYMVAPKEEKDGSSEGGAK